MGVKMMMMEQFGIKTIYKVLHIHNSENKTLYYLFAVVEVRVINPELQEDDMVFPSIDPHRPSYGWNTCGNSLVLTADAVRELGVDGLFNQIFK